jgi:CopG family transcriptional regulator / antitoxin EndoAI
MIWIDVGMSKRINIVLPEGTLRTIDRLVKPGGRSRFINQAVEHFVTHQSVEALRSQLERAATRDRDLDRDVVSDWLSVDSEAWRKLDIEERERNPAGPGGAKSISRRSIRR